MPTPRKSLAELALTGTLQRHPGRYAARLSGGTLIEPIGRAPSHLSTSERVTWTELTKQAPPGLLTKHDRISVEIVTKMVVRMRTSELKMSELSSITAILGKLGMTSHGRSKMELPEPPVPAAERTAEQKAWDELDELDD